MLSVLSAYIQQIPPIAVDGIYGSATRDAVLAAQRWFGLPQTGAVDDQTWDRIYDQFSGIENRTLRSEVNFPNTQNTGGAVTAGNFNPNSPPAGNPNRANRNRYSQTSTMTQFPGRDLQFGNQDPVRQEVVR